jgi:hypothetical protein
MADIDRVELLMRLSQNARADNDEWRRQIWREGNERAKRINELLAMFEKEYGALAAEQDKLQQYLPRREEMPKVVSQGPKE